MKSRGSSRNKVRPVAVEPRPAAAADRAAGVDEPAGLDTDTAQEQHVRPKPTRRRSHSGRVDKSESRSQQWSLRKGLGLFQKSLRAGTVKTPRPAPRRTCADSPEDGRVNASLMACATGLPGLQKTKNVSIAGTGGALGLTPVTAMFKMQTITTVKPQENQLSTGKKRKAKDSTKTPAKRRAKRQILGTLNQTETATVTKKPTPVQQTAPIMPSYTFRRRRSGLSDTADRTSLGSVRYGGTLTREWSTGTMSQTLDELNMNLETSIMNTLYPDGKSFMTEMDESVLSDSMYSADSSQDDTLPQTTRHTARLQRCNSMRLMRRNLSKMLRTSPRLSQTINLGHELQSPDISNVEESEKNSQGNPTPSCLVGKNTLEDSYIKAQVEALVKTPGDGAGTLEVKRYRALSARTTRRVSPVEKACLKNAADNSSTPRCPGQPIRRSRSLRMWGKEEGAVVTGYAGNTPKPQRRRPSANERLIM